MSKNVIAFVAMLICGLLMKGNRLVLEPAPEPSPVLDLTSKIQMILSAMPNLTCDEKIFRHKVTGTEEKPLDQITAAVDVVQGHETYSRIRKLNFDGTRRRRGESVRNFAALGGAWSSGEFFTALSTSLNAVSSTGAVIPETGEERTEQVRIPFQCPGTCWIFYTSSTAYRLLVEGELSVNRGTGDPLELAWMVRELPAETGIKSLELKINYENIFIAGKEWVVPVSGWYQITYKHDRRDWNLTEFTNYRRFGSETSVTFGELEGEVRTIDQSRATVFSAGDDPSCRDCRLAPGVFRAP